VFECASTISRFYEVFAQRENAQALLETYVGKRSGARVLGGEIRRGDGDEIDAAIMFCDLRGSTRLEQELSRSEYLALLNHFFETVSEIVEDNGGEVLKFVGDGVLVVFPVVEDRALACHQALSAARAIRMDLAQGTVFDACECAIGIDFGTVTYGNVGSRSRLDFTVIGQAANVAARLCDYGKTAQVGIVATRSVAGDTLGVRDLGPISLHNVADPIEGVAVADVPG